MFFDDYVMRQVRKIAELIAKLGGRAAGATYEDIEAALLEAYRAVIGMEPELADRLTVESLARMVRDPDQVRVLAHLLQAHGDVCASRQDDVGAMMRWERALTLLDHADDAELRASLTERLSR